jgi:hypothetical protein
MILIPTPELGSVACCALEMEGLDVEEWPCRDDYAYGRMFARFWDRGEPFVVVEWDIIPWPGAVTGLVGCPEPWCSHRYPLAPGLHWTTSFGIGKYAPQGKALAEWRKTPWRLLDGAVIPVLRERLASRPHVHEPPVAHAKRGAA